MKAALRWLYSSSFEILCLLVAIIILIDNRDLKIASAGGWILCAINNLAYRLRYEK